MPVHLYTFEENKVHAVYLWEFKLEPLLAHAINYPPVKEERCRHADFAKYAESVLHSALPAVWC